MLDSVGSAVSGVTNWQFLNEPLYRWAIFVVALSMIIFAYNGVLSLMKD